MTETTQTHGRYALIVAESNYRDPKLRKLRAPTADAGRLATVLKDPDIGSFEVETALDEDEAQLRRRIARFFSNRRPDDLLLVHFSCHGVKDENGELYLAAKDTEVGDLLGATGISAAWLSEQIGRCRSKRVVVLLDCCFSGSFPFGMRSRAGEVVDVHDHLEGRGRAVITASSSMEYSYEGDKLTGHGQPSIFTGAVVEGLRSGKADRDGDKWISVDDLYDYVYERVKETTPAQTPTKMSTLEGRVYLGRSVYERPVEPAKLDDELLALIKHPIASARLGGVQELAKLRADDDRAVALAARQILEQMINDDSLSVREAVQAALHESTSRSESPRVVANRVSEPRKRRAEAKSGTVSTDAKALRSRSSIWWLTALSVAVLVGGFVLAGASARDSGANKAGGVLFIVGAGGLLVAAVLAIRNKLRRGG